MSLAVVRGIHVDIEDECACRITYGRAAAFFLLATERRTDRDWGLFSVKLTLQSQI
jgi:hypothetical protein